MNLYPESNQIHEYITIPTGELKQKLVDCQFQLEDPTILARQRHEMGRIVAHLLFELEQRGDE